MGEYMEERMQDQIEGGLNEREQMQKEIEILREAVEFIASQGDLKGNWAVERARLALRECREI